MPWIDENTCAGCAVCVDVCPAGAIRMEKKRARIDDGLCIRCGKCHDVCPAGAVRHDSERLPHLVADNQAYVARLTQHTSTAEERRALLDRLTRHFRLQQKVAEQTIAWIAEQ